MDRLKLDVLALDILQGITFSNEAWPLIVEISGGANREESFVERGYVAERIKQGLAVKGLPIRIVISDKKMHGDWYCIDLEKYCFNKQRFMFQ